MVAPELSMTLFPLTTIVPEAKMPSIAPSIVSCVLAAWPGGITVGADRDDELFWQPKREIATNDPMIAKIPYLIT
jgi:hypothetical protein